MAAENSKASAPSPHGKQNIERVKMSRL